MKNSDNKFWLHTEREKTCIGVDIPLLPKALLLLSKYREHPMVLHRNRLFPVMNNNNQQLELLLDNSNTPDS